jgi:hypothetical protein
MLRESADARCKEIGWALPPGKMHHFASGNPRTQCKTILDRRGASHLWPSGTATQRSRITGISRERNIKQLTGAKMDFLFKKRISGKIPESEQIENERGSYNFLNTGFARATSVARRSRSSNLHQK